MIGGILLVGNGGNGAASAPASPTVVIGPPVARVGQSAYIGGAGDSISVGTGAGGATHSYQKYAADYLNCTYIANGQQSLGTSAILAAYPADVLSKDYNFTIIEGGINDVYAGVNANTTITNLKAMIDAVIGDGSVPVYLPISPWTAGLTLQNQKVDYINTKVLAWIALYRPTVVVADWRPVLGQFRTGGDAGNLWDLKTAYNYDGAHFTDAGYQAAGLFIGQTIANSY